MSRQLENGVPSREKWQALDSKVRTWNDKGDVASVVLLLHSRKDPGPLPWLRFLRAGATRTRSPGGQKADKRAVFFHRKSWHCSHWDPSSPAGPVMRSGRRCGIERSDRSHRGASNHHHCSSLLQITSSWRTMVASSLSAFLRIQRPLGNRLPFLEPYRLLLRIRPVFRLNNKSGNCCHAAKQRCSRYTRADD